MNFYGYCERCHKPMSKCECRDEGSRKGPKGPGDAIPGPFEPFVIPSRVPVLQPLATVEPEGIEWLWHGRIARGKVHLIDGDPGVGKSTLAIQIAANITTGTPWPDQQPCPTGNVIIMSAEDGLADTVRPRLDAAHGDPDKVHALTAISEIIDGEEQHRPPTIADIDAIEHAVQQTGAVLLIIDVLMAYLPGGIDSHKDQDVRRVLSRLTHMAETTGCAVILLRHLNKGSGSALYRGGGSIGISGNARVVHLVGRSPDDPDLLVFASVKNNIARAPESLTYRIVDGGTGTGRIAWEGTSSLSANDLTVAQGEDDQDEANALATFLRRYLTEQGGEAAAADVRRAVTATFGAVSKSALTRARARAGIGTRKVGYESGWVWQLNEGSIEGSEGSGVLGAVTFGPFALPSEPLDDPWDDDRDSA